MRPVSTIRSVAAGLVAAAVAASPLALGPASATTPRAASGTVAAAAGDPDCPQLQLADHWYGDNAALIQRAIDRRGRCSWGDDPPERKPFAVFDWDNTVIKNDISDQTIFWMLRNDLILQPPKRDWHTTSRFMTDAGAKALSRACGRKVAPGKPLPTSTDVGCTDELLSVRKDAVTTSGAEVFEGFNHRRMEASYAWVAQLLQGYTPAQVRGIAADARDAALQAPVGATWKVGSGRETAWIRYYPEIRDLIATLKAAGIEPWIVSASAKEFADVWGSRVGIDRAHTIGVFQKTTDGRLNGHLEGCGGIGNDSIMTYVDGKRCFINKRILGIQGPRALSPMPAERRQVLAGGDATTDISMLTDATAVHVVLNRNKDELMCVAYDDFDGKWAINPMFIDPLPKRSGKYPCSTTAYVDRFGHEGPVRRKNGSIIPDQEDTVFG